MDPDSGVKKAPDPGSDPLHCRSGFSEKKCVMGPDSGVKKHQIPDPNPQHCRSGFVSLKFGENISFKKVFQREPPTLLRES
jgi:hypothetical protein